MRTRGRAGAISGPGRVSTRWKVSVLRWICSASAWESKWRPVRGEITLKLSNSAAGHMLPTGDPERFIQVEVRFSDEDGRTVGETHRERIGQTWEWWPAPRKLGDNRLAPLEARTIRIGRPHGASKWSLVATSHRISPEAAQYHGLDGYPASRVTHQRRGDFPARLAEHAE